MSLLTFFTVVLFLLLLLVIVRYGIPFWKRTMAKPDMERLEHFIREIKIIQKSLRG